MLFFFWPTETEETKVLGRLKDSPGVLSFILLGFSILEKFFENVEDKPETKCPDSEETPLTANYCSTVYGI